MRAFLPGTAKLAGAFGHLSAPPNVEVDKKEPQRAMTRKGLTYATFTGIKTKGLNAKTGEIEAICNSTDVVDLQNERMVKGCWSKVIAKMRAGTEPWPTLLWGHEWSQPVGVVDFAEERDGGLYIKGRFNLGTQRGEDAYSDVAFGAIRQLSVGYMPDERSVQFKEGSRWVYEVAAWPECSFVLVGASPGTRVLALKSGTTLSEDQLFQYQVFLEDHIMRKLIASDEAKRRKAAPQQPQLSPREQALADIRRRVAAR